MDLQQITFLENSTIGKFCEPDTKPIWNFFQEVSTTQLSR